MGLDKGKNDKKCFNKHMLFCEFSRCLEALKDRLIIEWTMMHVLRMHKISYQYKSSILMEFKVIISYPAS